MRKMIITGMMAAMLMPVTAQAQSAGEIRRDLRDVQQERRDLDRAYRSGDPRRIQEERRDLRDARAELRDDRIDRNRNWGRDDWRSYRNNNRAIYARGDWRAPFGYRNFGIGARMAPSYYSARYYLADPWRYRLPPARGYAHWVRHYNDVLLVDTRRGVVLQAYRNFFY